MYLKPILFSLIIFSFYSLSYGKNLALSFDDGLNPTINPRAQQINNNLLHHLSSHDIKSIIFPSYIKIGDIEGEQLIKQWGDQNHLIGNHNLNRG